MRIILVNKFNHIKGGADKYFLDLSQLLKENGHKVAEFCMLHSNNLPSKYEKYFVSNVDFNRFCFKNIIICIGRILYSRQASMKFKKLIEDFKPDIVHIHNIYHQISPSILPIAKKKNIPVIMHLHDYKIMCPNYKMYNSKGICEACLGGKYYNCVLRRCVKKSFLKSLLASLEMYLHHRILKIYKKNVDLYIAPSQFMKKKAIEWGIDPKKINVLSYFINVEEFKPEFKPGNYFLYFGRLSEEKGINSMLEAIKRIERDVKLKIVGSGEYFKNIKKKIKTLNIENKVEIIGPKYGEDLRDIIKKSLAVIMPSEWYEISGIVNMEAGALGKPVVASDIGGISEIILNNKTGYLFKPGEAENLAQIIRMILDNKEKNEELGRQGRAFISIEFSPKKHLKKIIDIYSRYVKKNH